MKLLLFVLSILIYSTDAWFGFGDGSKPDPDKCMETTIGHMWRLMARDEVQMPWEYFTQFFMALDYGLDDLIDLDDFVSVWTSLVGMSEEDSKSLYHILASYGDTDADEGYIGDDNVWALWKDLAKDPTDEFYAKKEDFFKGFRDIMKQLPTNGCLAIDERIVEIFAGMRDEL